MDLNPLKLSLLDLLEDCSAAATNCATWAWHLFDCYSHRVWITWPLVWRGRVLSWPALPGPYGDGVLGVLDHFRLTDFVDYVSAQTEVAAGRRLAIQLMATSRQETSALFGTHSLTYHSLAFKITDDLVFQTWRAAGGGNRFQGGHRSNWLYRLSPDEIRATVSRLMFTGQWGGRPLEDVSLLRNELTLEHIRGTSAVLNLPDSIQSEERTPDKKTDKRKKNAPKLPQNRQVMELIRLYQSDLPKGRTKTEVALDLAENDKLHADNLMRQARRFKHLH